MEIFRKKYLMVILTSILSCSIMTYHESRSATWKEQFLVASTAYNRAVAQSKPINEVIFAKNQYSAMSRFKQRLNFRSYSEMLSYYRITDNLAFGSALSACGYAQDNANGLIYYHDKRIKSFTFNAGKPSVKTTNFTFYKGA